MWLTQRCGQGVHSGVLSASTGMRFWGVIILMISRKRAAGCGVIPNLSIESVCGFTCVQTEHNIEDLKAPILRQSLSSQQVWGRNA